MTNTFMKAASPTFVLAVDGANYGRFGLLVEWGSSATVHVYIGTVAPTENTQDYLVMQAGGTRELVANLAAADKVYVRTMAGNTASIRGFQEGRT